MTHHTAELQHNAARRGNAAVLADCLVLCGSVFAVRLMLCGTTLRRRLFDPQAYLLARAIQFWTPGVPVIYYIGLFAGANDMAVRADELICIILFLDFSFFQFCSRFFAINMLMFVLFTVVCFGRAKQQTFKPHCWCAMQHVRSKRTCIIQMQGWSWRSSAASTTAISALRVVSRVADMQGDPSCDWCHLLIPAAGVEREAPGGINSAEGFDSCR